MGWPALYVSNVLHVNRTILGLPECCITLRYIHYRCISKCVFAALSREADHRGHIVGIQRRFLPFSQAAVDLIWSEIIFIYLLVYLFICLFIYLFIMYLLCIYLCIIYLFIYLFICLFVNLYLNTVFFLMTLLDKRHLSWKKWTLQRTTVTLWPSAWENNHWLHFFTTFHRKFTTWRTREMCWTHWAHWIVENGGRQRLESVPSGRSASGCWKNVPGPSPWRFYTSS